MDFTLNDEQDAMAGLAATILGDRATPEDLRAHEHAGGGMLSEAWVQLAAADLLGIHLPESCGGGGYGVLEASLIAEQVGRHVAPVPYSATVAASLALASAGGHDALLRQVIVGEATLAVAVPGALDSVVLDGGLLHGSIACVPWAGEAAALVVAAGGRAVVVERGAAGLRLEPEVAVHGLPQSTAHFDGVPSTDAGTAGALVDAATVLACAEIAGVCEGALRLTAGHAKERHQFGSPIGTFQAVGHRLADAYIDTEAVRLTARQAAWRVAEGLPAAEEIDIAKLWAAEAGHRVVHAAQHIHGGVGVDLDYPIHRYFRWAKAAEVQLGHATAHLRSLGRALAGLASPAGEL